MFYNKLGNTGIKVSHISFSGSSYGSTYGVNEENRAVSMVKKYIQNNLNYFDTSPWYGMGSSEKILAEAFKDIPRNSIYIATKVGRYDNYVDNMYDFSEDRTEYEFIDSLYKLGVSYVDTVQVHDVSFAPNINIVLNETLPALGQFVKEGKCRFIGLVDYDLELMTEIIDRSQVKISSIVSYGRSTLLDNSLQQYIPYFRDNNIAVINGGCTGMGLLTNKGPPCWHPASDETKRLCRRAAKYCMDRKVELGRLAAWYTLNQPNIDTNLCDLYDMEHFDKTCRVVTGGLNDKETEVYNEVTNRFFSRETNLWVNTRKPIKGARLNRVSAA